MSDQLLADALATADATQPACPICGGTEFSPAPNGRLSRSGQPPRCTSCKSLERHRAGRVLTEVLRHTPERRAPLMEQMSWNTRVADIWRHVERAG